jgi:hypothetical protein
MATPGDVRQRRNAVERALKEQEGAARYQLRQREVRRGRDAAVNGARPLEFDEGGFPIPQALPRFVQRIGRLLRG